MTLLPVLPNELMLLLYKHQTTISDLLALSSTNHNMRSLFIDNVSSILSAICKNADRLSAAEVLVSIISKTAKLQPQACAYDPPQCDPPGEHHLRKNIANQHYTADGLAPFPIELRDLRAISRTHNVAMLVANKAIEFWTARAAKCRVDHEMSTVDSEKFAQAYILLWVCAESHWLSEFDTRARKLGFELLHREIMLLREIFEFSSFDLDRPTKLSTGSADPDQDEEDIKIEEVWFQLNNRGDREDDSLSYETNSVEWWFWNHSFKQGWGGVYVPYQITTEWEGDKPRGCHCPKATWVKWDLVQFDWWHTWDRLA